MEKVPSPVKDDKSDSSVPRELTPDYAAATQELYAKIEKKVNDKNFQPNPEDELDQMVDVLRSRLGEKRCQGQPHS